MTVSDRRGVIVYMNDAAIERYGPYGGAALIGSNMLDCHPEPSRTKVAEMLATPGVNAYTIERAGVRSLVYQTTWYEQGEAAGLVELILDLPEAMEHFVRDA